MQNLDDPGSSESPTGRRHRLVPRHAGWSGAMAYDPFPLMPFSLPEDS